jgi:hypothetical protein
MNDGELASIRTQGHRAIIGGSPGGIHTRLEGLKERGRSQESSYGEAETSSSILAPLLYFFTPPVNPALRRSGG